MKVFSYGDYIKSIHIVKRNIVNGLAEESEKYSFDTTKGDKIIENKPHDKLIKDILKDKNEIVNLVNKFLKPNEKIFEKNIEKYTNSYITRRYKSKEADIVYKMKDIDIYFLIEHQSTVDYNMPYRILNYCIDIIQEWKREQKGKKIYRYPIVVPIVVYTGKTKWSVSKNYKDQQLKITTYEKYRIDLAYNLIDINLYSTNDLLQKGTMFSYALLIEKSKDKEDLIKYLKLIINKENDKEKLDKISNIIIYLFNGILEKAGQKKLLEIINKKVGESNMESLVERIVEEEKRQRKELEKKAEKRGEKIGKEKAKKEIINKIKLKISNLNEDDNIIEKINNIINSTLIEK